MAKTHYTVKVSSANMPLSCWGRYVNVAVIECQIGTYPTQIRTTKTQTVIRVWLKRHVGKTNRSPSQEAITEATELANRLNSATGDI